MNDLKKLSGLELSKLIKDKKISTKEMYLFFSDLIRRFNPVLNAVVETYFEHGLELATNLENKNSDTLYFGVPFTCKEMIAIKGLHQTGGSYYFRNSISDYDASVVQAFKENQMLLLGTTNVPEFGFWFETKNTIYGRTSNPFNEKRTSGGSSGGEAAIIGLGASPLGIGSDIGGSLRIPASFCGIFAHKPSFRLVPLTGHFPFSLNDFPNFTDDYPITSIGPMCRRADDLLPLLKIMSHTDGVDSQVDINLISRLNHKPKLKNVYFINDLQIHGANKINSEINSKVKLAVQYFEQLGHPVKELKSGFFKDSIMMWLARLSLMKRSSFAELISPGKSISFFDELSKIIQGHSKHTLPAFLLSILDGKLQTKEQELHYLNQLKIFKQDINTLLGDHSILIFPTQPRVAPFHNELFLSPLDFIYSGIFNALETPVTQVPMGLSQVGLPIGIQIVGGLGSDRLTIESAQQLELAFGGWVAPEFLTN